MKSESSYHIKTQVFVANYIRIHNSLCSECIYLKGKNRFEAGLRPSLTVSSSLTTGTLCGTTTKVASCGKITTKRTRERAKARGLLPVGPLSWSWWWRRRIRAYTDDLLVNKFEDIVRSNWRSMEKEKRLHPVAFNMLFIRRGDREI